MSDENLTAVIGCGVVLFYTALIIGIIATIAHFVIKFW